MEAFDQAGFVLFSLEMAGSSWLGGIVFINANLQVGEASELESVR